MKEYKKAIYTAPVIEVIVMENEGIIAASLGGVDNGGSATNANYGGRRSYNSASTSELEDLINDILTIEQ